MNETVLLPISPQGVVDSHMVEVPPHASLAKFTVSRPAFTASAILAILFVAINISSIYINRNLDRAKGKTRVETRKAGQYPHWDPVFGLDLLIILTRSLFSHQYLETTRKLLEKYRKSAYTAEYLYFGKPAIITMEPENIKTMLSTKFRDFAHGEDRLKSLVHIFGNGILNNNGEAWKHSRTTLRPFASRRFDSDLELFETHVMDFMAALPKDGATVDLQPLFTSLTMDTVTHVFLGKSTGVLSKTTGPKFERGRKFAKAHTLAQLELMFSDLNVFDLITGAIGATKRYRHATEARQLLREMIQECAETLPSKTHDGENHEPLTFVQSALLEGQGIEEIWQELVALISAGKDTTSAVLGHIWFSLARNPRVFHKLQEEVNEHFGGRKPTSLAELARLKYLKNVIDETLRLFPPLPINMRSATVDTVLPVGGGADGQAPLFVAKGVSVGYTVYGLHRRKDLWGEDAEDFRPERWDEMEHKPGWNFLPFNGGPRICLGQQFATNLISFAIVRLLQSISRVENRDPEPWVESMGITTFSKNGVKVSLEWK